ncbi:hypothetical protein GCM10020369_32960 [Cryptosporangium minutisporangium]|uniref:DNA primase/polymerase bifunctional N-terminal domain-containing protein n=1 Tax=Cryptosporangium minutisporangium TaxID=113569 RepID=A0ABP6SZD3_9ACTN
MWVSDLHQAGTGPDQVAAWYARQAAAWSERAASNGDDPEATARANFAAWNQAIYARRAAELAAGTPAPPIAEPPTSATPDLFNAPEEPPVNTSQNALLDAALSAAGRGWHVFPLRPGQKRPAITDWENRATTDPDRIRRCWSTGAFNVGIATGPSGLVVVDLDTPKDGADAPEEWRLPGIRSGQDVLAVLADQASSDLPLDTYTVATPSGGLHLYYAHPDGPELRNTAGRLGWLIDTRAHGGYVVAAGSLVDGHAYTATYDAPPAPLPPWLALPLTPTAPSPVRPSRAWAELLATAKRRNAYAAAALTGERDRVLNATSNRNDALNTAAYSLGRLVGSGALDRDLVVTVLTDAGLAAGLEPGETSRAVRSGLDAGSRNPREVAA